VTNTLTIIGSRAGSPGPEGPASGYHLATEYGRVLMDCGPGVLAGLTRERLHTDLDAVLVSHQHADHSADLAPLGYHRAFPVVRPPIPLLAPKGIEEYLAALDAVHGIPTLAELKTPIATQLPFTAIEPGRQYAVGDLLVDTLEAKHPVPTLSFRFPQLGLVYTADTALTDELIEFSRGARLLLAEATYVTPEGRNFDEHGHMSGIEAGRLAAEAAVEHLVLTHFSDFADADQTREYAHAQYDGPISLAQPGQRYRLSGSGAELRSA